MIPLSRSLRDRILLGVCGGIAERIGVHAGWFRLAFIVAGLASGIGILLYLALSVAMQPPGGADMSIAQRMRGNLQELRYTLLAATDAFERWREQRNRLGATDDLRTLVGIAAVVGGLFVLLWSFGLFWWLDFWRTCGLVVVLIGLGLLMPRGRRRPQAVGAPAPKSRSILAAPALVVGLVATFGIILTGATVQVLDDDGDDASAFLDALSEPTLRELETLRQVHEHDQATIARLERRIDVLEAWPGMLALMGGPAPARQRVLQPPPDDDAAHPIDDHAAPSSSPWPLPR